MQLMITNRQHSSTPLRRVSLPRIAFVVARSVPNHIIGCDNSLPWHLKDDLKRFRKITSGHVVIMGRRTLESIGKPLPNRDNIVISRGIHQGFDGVHWASSREEAMFLADYMSILRGVNDFFVIGGESIYKSFSDLFYRIYLTEIIAPDLSGDAHFDYILDGRKWEKMHEEEFPVSEGNEFPSNFYIYDRKRKSRRMIDISDYMSKKEQFLDYYRKDSERRLKKDRKIFGHYGDLFDEYAKYNAN